MVEVGKMPERVEVCDIEGLGSVADRLHDEIMVVDRIRRDVSRRAVEIPFACARAPGLRPRKGGFLVRSYEVPLSKALLRIEEVDDFQLLDRARINLCEFQTATYDTRLRELVLSACVDLKIRLHVLRLAAVLEVYDVEVGRRSVKRILGVMEYSPAGGVVLYDDAPW